MERLENGDLILKRQEDFEILIRIDERTKALCIKMEEIKDYKEVKERVSWLVRFFWILATGVISGFIMSLSAILVGR